MTKKKTISKRSAVPKKVYLVFDGAMGLSVPFASREHAQACADENNDFLGRDRYRRFEVIAVPNGAAFRKGKAAVSWDRAYAPEKIEDD